MSTVSWDIDDEEPDGLNRFTAQHDGECGQCGDDFFEGETCAFTEEDVLIGPCCIDVEGG